jgi:hypothetical protein
MRRVRESGMTVGMGKQVQMLNVLLVSGFWLNWLIDILKMSFSVKENAVGEYQEAALHDLLRKGGHLKQ